MLDVKLGRWSANIITNQWQCASGLVSKDPVKLSEGSLTALVSRYPARVHLRAGDRDLGGDQDRRGIPGYVSTGQVATSIIIY